MPCPFCHSLLDKYEYEAHAAYECENKACLNDDMPRYKMVFINRCCVSETVMFQEEGLYIQLDHAVNRTVISKLEVCMLTDNVIIPKILEFNKYEHDALPKLLSKVKMLMVFS
jgi:hypothetical protein